MKKRKAGRPHRSTRQWLEKLPEPYVGYETDLIKKDSDSYSFTTSDGEKLIIPKSSVNQIEEHD